MRSQKQSKKKCAEQVFRKMHNCSLDMKALETLFKKTEVIFNESIVGFQEIMKYIGIPLNDRGYSAVGTILNDLSKFVHEAHNKYIELCKDELHVFNVKANECFKETAALSEGVNSVVLKISQLKRVAEEKKAAYFKASSQLCRAETELQKLISRVESGNLNFGPNIAKKTDEVLQLRETVKEVSNQYTASIYEINQTIKTNKEYYKDIIRGSIKLREECNSSLRLSFNKYIELIKEFIKNLAHRIQHVVLKVKEEDKEFVLSEEQELLFAPVERAKFDLE